MTGGSDEDEVVIRGPECRAGKHGNCDGRGMDMMSDEIVPCPCSCHGRLSFTGEIG